MRVEHRRITREWQQQMAKSLLDSDAQKRTKAAQCCWTKRSLEATELGEFLDDKMHAFRTSHLLASTTHQRPLPGDPESDIAYTTAAQLSPQEH
jgi:hypothetical protein